MVDPADEAPAVGLRSRYEAFRSLLDRNEALLELLAELELDLRMLVPGDSRIGGRVRRLLEDALLQIQTLNLLSDGRFRRLYRVHGRIENEVWSLLRRLREECRGAPLIVPLAQVTRPDEHLVGGKAARLGDLAGRLPESVPPGFVVTSPACSRLLARGEASARLREILQDIDVIADPAQLGARVARARDLVRALPVPEEVSHAIDEAARPLRGSGAGGRWAVRSSAVGEDGPVSFAGQFDSILDVPQEEIVGAWRRVVSSMFSPRAVSFRLACGVAELSTPMAVLCMPMVEARWAGVMHTRDPTDPEAETMQISAVEGRGAKLVGGEVEGQTFRVARDEPVRVLGGNGGASSKPVPRAPLEEAALSSLVTLGRVAEEHFEEALEVEWAIDRAGKPLLLQARPLTVSRPAPAPRREGSGPVLAEGGAPIVVGRAVGPVCRVEDGAHREEVPRGSVLVVPDASPEYGHLLPRVEGLVTEHGSVAGHLASLAREFGVPSVFGMVGAAARLPGGELVSLDAGRCKVYAGNVWVGEEPVARRLERERRATPRSPLHRLVLGLALTDPRAPNFRPGGCRSIHDIVRFCHERGIGALFEPGPWSHRPERSGAQRLLAPQLPNQVWVLDVGGGVATAARGQREVAPEDVASLPFRALWRGVTAPGVEWRGRTGISLRGFASVVSSSLLQSESDPRALAAAAYMIVASHHLNLNARLAYHYAMIVARVDEVSEGNHVRFRFWGGGAMPAQRDLRALFLARVLWSLGFTVERRGDLVAAALLRHPPGRSEQALEALGTLMGCARQLDMLLDSDSRVEHYVQRFLEGDYEAFA